MINTQIQGTFE